MGRRKNTDGVGFLSGIYSFWSYKALHVSFTRILRIFHIIPPFISKAIFIRTSGFFKDNDREKLIY